MWTMEPLKLYLLDIRTIPPDRFDALLDTLPESRREKTRFYRFEKDRLLSLAAGLTARQALAEAGRSEALLRYGENGRPYLEGRPELDISLSHSGNYAACVLGPGPAAVDVQEHEGEHESILRRCYTEAERAWCDAAETPEERQRRFYHIWCKKECRMKLRTYQRLTEIDTDTVDPGCAYAFYPLENHTLAVYGREVLLPPAPIFCVIS